MFDKARKLFTDHPGEPAKAAAKSRSLDTGGPSPRFGSALTMRQGVIYLFGGIVEDEEDRQLTFKDFYSLGEFSSKSLY